MNERDADYLMLQLADVVSPGTAPVADIVRSGRAASSRRRKIRTVGVLATTAMAIALGGGLYMSLGHDSASRLPVAKDRSSAPFEPMKRVQQSSAAGTTIGSTLAVVTIPNSWPIVRTPCGVDPAYAYFDSLEFASARCPYQPDRPPLEETSILAVVATDSERGRVISASVVDRTQVGELTVVSSGLVCENESESHVRCTQVFGIEGSDVVFDLAVTGPGARELLDTIRDSLRTPS